MTATSIRGSRFKEVEYTSRRPSRPWNAGDENDGPVATHWRLPGLKPRLHFCGEVAVGLARQPLKHCPVAVVILTPPASEEHRD